MYMTTILCPTDLSVNARSGIDYAIHLSQMLEAQLVLVYVEPIPYLDPETFIAAPIVETLEEVHAQMKVLTQNVSEKVACTYQVESGDAPGMILKAAKEQNADWIVMGTKGAGNSPEVMVGSVAAEVAQTSPYPVIIIPTASEFLVPKKIVLATDFQHTSRQLLTPLIALATCTQAVVMALHIEATPHTLSEAQAVEAIQLTDWLENIPASVHVVVKEDIQEGIEEFAEQQKADMVAVIARKHGFFASLFHRSITRLVTLYTTRPLLVIPEKSADA